MNFSDMTALPVHSGRGLGFLSTYFCEYSHCLLSLIFIVLGASLHDIISRLKSLPQTYPILELTYSSSKPVETPVLVHLPANGLRLSFDGPGQGLRLIEVLDFSKIRLSYKSQDIAKLPDRSSSYTSSSIVTPGPTFRHIYHKLFGLTYAGEYLTPRISNDLSKGIYILSYPGIAFSFPLDASAWDPSKDHVALLSSPSAGPATSMAIFEGPSWPEARTTLYTKVPTNPRSLAVANKTRDIFIDEVESAKLHKNGRVELVRHAATPLWIIFGETTVQDLVTELGPPSAIYGKSDRKLSIHQNRATNFTDVVTQGSPSSRDESTDTENSSSLAGTDDSDVEEEEANASSGTEFFYNYFNYGFDLLVSSAPGRSQRNYGSAPEKQLYRTDQRTITSHSTLTVTKILLHGNVPGSYPFNRHRRLRWSLEHVSPTKNGVKLNSEMHFSVLSDQLRKAFRHSYSSPEEEKAEQRNMVLNRGWGDSPGSSCEFLGDWEESGNYKRDESAKVQAASGEENLGNTELFGFPGMVFEVLKSGSICCLTVF